MNEDYNMSSALDKAVAEAARDTRVVRHETRK